MRLWVEELLRSEAAFPALAWLSNGTLSGSGTPDDPWALRPLSAAPELLIWLEPDGPMLAAHPELVDHLLPDPIDADARGRTARPRGRARRRSCAICSRRARSLRT